MIIMIMCVRVLETGENKLRSSVTDKLKKVFGHT